MCTPINAFPSHILQWGMADTDKEGCRVYVVYNQDPQRGAHVLEDAAADVAVHLLHVRLGQAQQPPQPVQLRSVLIWQRHPLSVLARQTCKLQLQAWLIMPAQEPTCSIH